MNDLYNKDSCIRDQHKEDSLIDGLHILVVEIITERILIVLRTGSSSSQASVWRYASFKENVFNVCFNVSTSRKWDNLTKPKARVSILRKTIAFVSFTRIIFTIVSHYEYGIGKTMHWIVVFADFIVCEIQIIWNNYEMYSVSMAILITW